MAATSVAAAVHGSGAAAEIAKAAAPAVIALAKQLGAWLAPLLGTDAAAKIIPILQPLAVIVTDHVIAIVIVAVVSGIIALIAKIVRIICWLICLSCLIGLAFYLLIR